MQLSAMNIYVSWGDFPTPFNSKQFSEEKKQKFNFLHPLLGPLCQHYR